MFLFEKSNAVMHISDASQGSALDWQLGHNGRYKILNFTSPYLPKRTFITKWADFITNLGSFFITFSADILLQNTAACLLQN